MLSYWVVKVSLLRSGQIERNIEDLKERGKKKEICELLYELLYANRGSRENCCLGCNNVKEKKRNVLERTENGIIYLLFFLFLRL